MGPSSVLEIYRSANRFLDEDLIRLGSFPPDSRTRRDWMERFLPRVHHPERAFEAVHVAGTSGKGSVATMVAEILRAAGIATGLHVSPYLQVSTEKLWVDGLYASAEELAALVDWIRPAVDSSRGAEVPLHGLASVAVTLEHFRRRGVELAVVEAGVGGRHDVTNVLRTRVAVITAVGLDHLKTLGPTLDDIAWHKAGIIKAGCRALVLAGPAVAAAQNQARAVGAPVRVIDHSSYAASSDEHGSWSLRYAGPHLQLENARLGMQGAFQGQNAALAVAAIEELAATGYRIPEEAVLEGLAHARLPGRMERISPAVLNCCPVLIDGAHNPDKLTAMLDAVCALDRDRLHVVYGGLASRTPDAEIRRLAALADTFVATEPRVHAKPARPAASIARAVADATRGRVVEEPDPARALEIALRAARPQDLVLVTGSIYLCGALRGHFYPEREVLEHQRSFF
jgi:dihydrofolate synthase/folylpolyglutamate synthase